MIKSLVIADTHSQYIEHIRGYLQKKYSNDYEIEVYMDKESLRERIQNKKCDILLFSSALYEPTLNLKNVKLPVILQADHEMLPQSEKLKWVIQKYMRISLLIEYIEAQYEEVERNRPLIYTFYSPAGGVGQSSVAIGTALRYLQAGKKVVYLNLEEMDSTTMFIRPKEGLSKKETMQVGKDQEAECIVKEIKQDSVTKLRVMPVNAIEMPELIHSVLGNKIEKIIDSNIANIVILDLGKHYKEWCHEFIKLSDYFVLVSDGRSHAQFKIKQLISQLSEMEVLNEKVKLIFNQSKVNVEADSVEVIGKIEKVYATTPLGICEVIAKSNVLKLHGLN